MSVVNALDVTLERYLKDFGSQAGIRQRLWTSVCYIEDDVAWTAKADLDEKTGVGKTDTACTEIRGARSELTLLRPALVSHNPVGGLRLQLVV